MGLSWRPAILNESLLDEVYLLNDRDCCSAARYLARRGLLVGPSAGAVFLVCCHLALTSHRNHWIAGVLADSGERYMQTIFSDAWVTEHGMSLWCSSDQLLQIAASLRPYSRPAAARRAMAQSNVNASPAAD
jgi:hypothetical protein